ncbi:MAG: HIT family protein [Patescibacteria group bacterium]|nr:HIT family protein [Patescibacteria group bacterium]
MEKNNCLFCKIVSGEIPAYKVYEDKHCLAFLDIYPAAKGHTLIIPKKHQQDIRDADPADLERLILLSKKLAKSYQQSLGAVGFNLKSNHGTQAQQEVPHLHFHLVPRYKDDGLNFVFPRHEANKEELGETKINITSHLTQS